MNEKPETNVKYVSPLKRICMTIGELPASYLETMSYYEMLVWFTEFLKNTVIPTVNNNALAVEELQTLYNELKDYVNNYFDELNIQEEVNNKLDEMAQSGELNEIFEKLDYFVVDNTFTQSEIQNLMNIENAKIIEFKDGTYNFDNTFILNKDTTLILNNANFVFSVTHGFFNFKTTDEFLTYNGNGNIKIIGGKINAGISFIHASNIEFKNINFYHVLNDHILELCALKNVYIEDCTFEGVATQSNDRDYVENIQIDDCTYENFPWLTENSSTYDNTPNININISNCSFKKPDIITYQLYTAIGMHTHIDDIYHNYINIKNNIFEETVNSCIRLINAENINIENNIFRSTQLLIANIDLRWHIKNIIIKNNDTNYQYFINANTRCINMTVDSNYIHDINQTSDSYYSIFTQPCINMKVINNIWENVYERIIDNRTRPDQLDNEIIIFENNIIRCENAGNFNTYFLALYGSSHVYVNNNILDVNPSNTCTFLRLSSNVLSATMKNNILKERSSNHMQLNGYTGSFNEIEGLFIVTSNINVSSITEGVTGTYNVLNFNRIGITCGSGTNTQNFVFKPFHFEEKITGRTYKFNCVQENGSADVGTLTVSDEGAITYSTASGNLNIRQIVTYNEY